jgi:hypothetical protein
MTRILVRTAIGTAIGALLGALPGSVAALVPFLAVGYGYSILLIYLGLLIGAGAGAVVGTMCAALAVLQGSAAAPARPLARAASH